MKNIFMLSILCLFTVQLSAQDTTIYHPNFILDIIKKDNLESYHYEKWDADKKVVAFHITGGIGEIIGKWLKFMELETADYRIEGDYGKHLVYVADSMGDTRVYKYDFEVILTEVSSDEIPVNPIEMQKEAFKIFAEVVGIEILTVLETQDYWELRILDMDNSISIDQDKFWKRTEYEDYIYYENIDIRRIADLLDRKLNAFVRPIPYNSDKFNIKMPHSNDFFDLKYAMIEHGFEITEVSRRVEVLVIRL
jgi:hypothetical protein